MKRKIKKKTKKEKTLQAIISDTPLEETKVDVQSAGEIQSKTHDPNCQLCGVVPKDPDRLWLIKNKETRMSRHVLSPDHDGALKESGWQKEKVLFAMITKSPLYIKRPVTDSATRVEGSDIMQSKKKTKEATGTGSRGSIFLFDFPVTSVLRWMGKKNLTTEQAKTALVKLNVKPMPADSTISIQVKAGKKGLRGDPAKLSEDQGKKILATAKANGKVNGKANGKESKRAKGKAKLKK